MAKDKITPAQLHALVEEAGGYVGVSAASKLLGIATANFKRYRDRLTAFKVEGSADAFLKTEVEELAKTLEAQRSDR